MKRWGAFFYWPLPRRVPKRGDRRASPALVAAIASAAAWLLVPAHAAAQSCQQTGTRDSPLYSCTLPAGAYAMPISFLSPIIPDTTAPYPLLATTQGTITVGATQGTALSISAIAATGFVAGEGTGLGITNSGALTVQSGSSSGNLYGLLAQEYGGAGITNSDHTGQLAGNSGPQIELMNSGAITIGVSSVGGTGAALYAQALGGQGGNADMDHSFQGGSGGSSFGATITNSGAISVTASGTAGYGGIEAVGQGGGAGSDAAVGGNGGSSSVTNFAPVSVTWAWQGSASTNVGVYGILAAAIGANGTSGNGTPGGHGGDSTSTSITLNAGANVSVNTSGTPPSFSTVSNFYGAGVATLTQGGNGDGGQSGSASTRGGVAGASGTIVNQIAITDASVTVVGNNMPALLALALGGAGGAATTGGPNNTPGSAGGAGGSTGNSSIKITASTSSLTFSANGSNAPAIVNLLQGGVGGVGADLDISGHGGDGGDGGAAGTSQIILTDGSSSTITVSTTSTASPALYAASIGAAAGNGGSLNANLGGKGGVGGAGGGGGDVTVNAGTSTIIVTQGDNSPGIVAQSQGGVGGNAGFTQATISSPASGGSGGGSGTVQVDIGSNSSITTSGQASSGIVAQGLSGAGGDAGGVGGLFAPGGNGGNGGSVGTVTVRSAAQIITSGDAARGILAQAISGGGGGGGNSFGAFFSSGGSGGSTGSIGDMTIENAGSISTAGTNAQGILAQSLGGTGGIGGQSFGAGITIGGTGGPGGTNPLSATAGNVFLLGEAGSSITTTGISSIGILGQSIGGGGGDGGTAGGSVAVTVGGNGGVGGSGGTVDARLTTVSVNTSGDNSHGVVMQSVGGGGGNAGNADGALGVFAAISIGGNGGTAGDGGSASIELLNGTTITTQGSKAAGIVVQSIGGGGGTGGNALAGSIGVGFSTSVTVGGQGGAGGGGSTVSAVLNGGSIVTGQNPALLGSGSLCGGTGTVACNLLPVDTYGAVIQSIGGGGGLGGTATARALALAVPGTEIGDQVALSATVALGGQGGNGGSGNTAFFSVNQGGTIVTSGQGGTGVLLQSIGGGGGAGGDSSALSGAFGYGSPFLPGSSTLGLEFGFSLGATGGTGGSGGTVCMALGGTVSACNGSPTISADTTSLSNSTITTYGDFAAGIKAQSIGGGGGDAGFGSGNTQNFGTGSNGNVTIGLGAQGGQGASGGQVFVNIYQQSAITTWGSGATGVLAQSVGGGGGTSSGGSYSFGATTSINDQTYVGEALIGVGSQGAAGGLGGNVSVNVYAPIITHGGDANAVLAQSIGGGGGVGGSAGSDASADNPIILGLNIREGLSNIESGSVAGVATFSLSLGGQGGLGNAGGAVTLGLSSGLQTFGDWSSAIVAQSVGGGGGKGGTAAATGTGGRPDITINADVALGGTGGNGGEGGSVTVGLNGSSIATGFVTQSSGTTGFGAAGVIAQSVGGGGGIGADGSDISWGVLSAGVAKIGDSGTAGNGGTVSLKTTNANTVVTLGEAAMGVVLQSVGGGGGIAGRGSSSSAAALGQVTNQKLFLEIGGGAGAGGSGGAVTFNDTGTIQIRTAGNNAYGLVAQSVGGGGGIVIQSQALIQQATTGSNIFRSIVAGSGRAGGESIPNDGGTVSLTLNSGSSITTAGTGAHGIIAQSIGGGGGIVGLPGTLPTLADTPPAGMSLTGTGFGNGGTVTVTNNGTIAVSGYGAIGILAQSIGGSGGLILASDVSGAGNVVYMGTTASLSADPGLQGSGGAVTVTSNGTVTASGINGVGIFAQSTAGGSVIVTANGSVTGGSGGRAIWIDSPTDSQVTVGSGGSLHADLGKAIEITGGGKVDVVNNGTITSELALNGGKLTNFGTYNPDADVNHDVVNGGTMIHRDGHIIGAVTVTTVNGGITQFQDTASATQTRLVTNAGGVVDISGTTNGLTVASIEGSGAYYLGGQQLTVGGNNSSTTVSGMIADNGNGGSLVKTGTGTFILNGFSSYSGGTFVQQGILQGTTTGLQGNIDISDHAGVVFDQTFAGTYAGVLSGFGSVTVQGSGLVNFTGNSTYTGPTTVTSGTLLVNGSLVSSVALTGGTLGGSGSIGNLVQTGGVLSPGNSIGTLTVNGTFSQSGGAYQVEANGLGQSDRVNVTGAATIGGSAAVQVMGVAGGIYRTGVTSTVLNATGGVSGTYSGASTNLAFVVPSLSYDANNVYLLLTPSFAAGAQNPNQASVAAVLDKLNSSATGDFSAVLDALSGLGKAQGAAALNAISGQPIANLGTMNAESSALFMNMLAQQLGFLHGGSGAGGQHVALAEACDIAACEGTASPWGAWISGFGGLGSVAGSASAGGLTYNFGGSAAGLDYRFDPDFLMGLTVGYAHGTQWVNGFSGQGSTDTLSAAIYASFARSGFYADALAGYAYTDNRMQRQIVIPGLSSRTANGATAANQFLAQIETGYQVPLWAPARASVTPFARLQGSTATTNAFTESGAQSLDLTVAAQTTQSLRTTFGADLAGTIPLAERPLDLTLRLGWQHEFADTARPMTAAFSGAPSASFTVYGVTPQRDAVILGLGAKTSIADATELYLRYDGQLASGFNNHALTAGVHLSW